MFPLRVLVLLRGRKPESLKEMLKGRTFAGQSRTGSTHLFHHGSVSLGRLIQVVHGNLDLGEAQGLLLCGNGDGIDMGGRLLDKALDLGKARAGLGHEFNGLADSKLGITDQDRDFLRCLPEQSAGQAPALPGAVGPELRFWPI